MIIAMTSHSEFNVCEQFYDLVYLFNWGFFSPYAFKKVPAAK